ncbi:hypothetical protein SAY86_030391 [Trapa natans]|uniref:Pentatricopeptide repeat-containing protein n=1 Tax=Trapa natans TaxID=22666 RepID=A0AAN7RDP1_TRANT|nr:hypothetical protein SAY86_030391 [Trapa natans]
MSLRGMLSPYALNCKSAVAVAGASVRSFCSSYPNPDPFVIPDEPTSDHYDGLVNSVGRDGDFDALHRLLNKRIKDGCFNTSRTFRFLDESSLPVLDELLCTVARLDAGITRKNAFDSLISRLCRIRHVDSAMRVVAAMLLDDAREVNAVTLHPIVNQLTRMKEFDRAWRLVEEARRMGVQPDLTVYNYFLTAHAAGGDISETIRMLERMDEEGMGADTRTYDAMVLAACRAGRPEGALALIRGMVDEGIPAMYSTHVHVINALLRQGHNSEAIEFVRAFSGRDDKLDSENFGILAYKFIKRKQFVEAKLVMETMGSRDLRIGDKLKSLYDKIRKTGEGNK